MTKLSWSEQYRHPSWQKKRLEALGAANWTCENCGDADTTLNVHHKRYVKGRMVWEYEISELAVLCEPCHQVEHEQKDLLQRLIAESAGIGPASVAVAMLGGYLYAGYDIDPGLAEMARQADPWMFELGVAAACLGNPDDWRNIVREHRRKFPHPNPAIDALIAEWDREEKKG